MSPEVVLLLYFLFLLIFCIIETILNKKSYNRLMLKRNLKKDSLIRMQQSIKAYESGNDPGVDLMSMSQEEFIKRYGDGPEVFCSFCNRSSKENKPMLAGGYNGGVWICLPCAELFIKSEG